MLSHQEYSDKAHKASHVAAGETNTFQQQQSWAHRTTCFHRTNGKEEKWSREESPRGVYSTWLKNDDPVENPDLDDEGLAYLIGRKIVGVDMTEGELKFHTDSETLTYAVDGDCCSRSYFYDMHGKEKLLENGPVVSIGTIELDKPDDKDPDDDYESHYVQAYGFEIVTKHPKWGEQTTTFSFRNDSNGFYGGDMHFVGIEKAGGK